MAKYVAKLFLILQIIYVLAWFAGERLLSLHPSFLGKWFSYGPFPSALVWSRANFDGFYYLKIARDGYQYLQQAFFPGYPHLIHFGHHFWHSYFGVAIFISNLSLLLVLWLWQKLLASTGHKGPIIRKSMLLLMIFPTSFYLISAYSESLFLFFVLAAFYLLEKRLYLLAGVLAAAASYTRPVGIFLLPALWVGYYQQVSRRKMKIRLKSAEIKIRQNGWRYFWQIFNKRFAAVRSLLFLSIGAAGFLKYTFFLKSTQNDWLYFIHVQPGFGAQRSINKVILIYQVIWRYLKMIVTVDVRQWLYFNVWFELTISLIFFGLLLWGWYRRREYKLRDSWLTFASFAYIVPTLTGTFSSMPRYVLVCFPTFIVLAELLSEWKKRPWGRRIHIEKLYLIFSVALLFLAAMLFEHGYWIS